MGFRASEKLPRCGSDGVWRLDYLETGILASSQWIPSADRPGVYDPVRKSSHHLHPLRARLILTFIALSGGATVATFYIQWKWG